MQAAQSTFISSTNWTERVGTVAALATIRKFRREKVAQHLIRIGGRVKAGWQELGRKAGLPLHVSGPPSLCHFAFEHADELAISTLFAQSMLEKRFLVFGQFKPSLAHQDKHVDAYLTAAGEVFLEIAKSVEQGTVAKKLKGPVIRRGFYRLA